MATFRRAFIDHGRVAVEVRPGQCWALPNPTANGTRYEAEKILRAVVAAREVNLELWEKIDD